MFGCMDHFGVFALYAVYAAVRPGGNLTQHLVLPAMSYLVLLELAMQVLKKAMVNLLVVPRDRVF